MLKKHAFVVASLYTLALTLGSLMTVRGLPDMGVSFSDKIYHFLAYALLTYLWYLVFFNKLNFKKNKAIFYAAIVSFVFGIIIEVLQGSITTARFSDVYDGLANAIGVLFTTGLLLINKKRIIKNL